MPNLKQLKLVIIIRNIKEDVYKKFIIKIFTLKLDEVDININNYENYYSEYELKEIYPEIDIKNIHNIKINKLY